MDPGDNSWMTHGTSLSVSTSYGLAVNHVPIAAMIKRLGILMTADAKGFNMAIGARFPLCQRFDTMPSHSPETGVILWTV
jgi:hypothetical protein